MNNDETSESSPPSTPVHGDGVVGSFRTWVSGKFGGKREEEDD